MDTPEDNATRYSETIQECKDLGELERTAELLADLIKKLPQDLQEWLRDEYRSVRDNLKTRPKDEQAIS